MKRERIGYATKMDFETSGRMQVDESRQVFRKPLVVSAGRASQLARVMVE